MFFWHPLSPVAHILLLEVERGKRRLFQFLLSKYESPGYVTFWPGSPLFYYISQDPLELIVLSNLLPLAKKYFIQKSIR